MGLVEDTFLLKLVLQQLKCGCQTTITGYLQAADKKGIGSTFFENIDIAAYNHFHAVTQPPRQSLCIRGRQKAVDFTSFIDQGKIHMS